MRAAAPRAGVIALAIALASGCSRGDRPATEGPRWDGGRADASVPPDAGAEAAARTCPVRCGLAAECCAAGEECVLDRCMAVCEGTRCGEDDGLCCGADELCLGGACITPGAACSAEGDCPGDETCDPIVRRCVPVPEGAACVYVPPPSTFEPEVQWAWGDGQVAALPLVVPRPGGAPDVAVLAYEGSFTDARLVVLSGADGSVLWRSPDDLPLCGSISPAAGDLDGDGVPEIVAVASDGTSTCGAAADLQNPIAFSADGSMLWRASASLYTGFGALAVADLEGDGSPEVVAEDVVLEADGTLRWRHEGLRNPAGLGIPTVADLDGDGVKEIVVSDRAVRADGTVLWTSDAVPAGHTAIARVVDDPGRPGPQVVAVGGERFAVLDGATGATLLGPVVFEPDGYLAGPPTVADFDGDGRPEIGTLADVRYVVLDPDLPAPHVRWSVPSEDLTTGSAGSTVFDFDGDGAAEVVYADECHVRILSGDDGELLWHAGTTSGTAMEYPVVADADADGNAELIVVSNDPDWLTCAGRSLPHDGPVRGVRVFRDVLDNWVPTRAVWNQHTYHVNNVRDDGTIPAVETASWSTHNTYRLNRPLEPTAPDLVVTALDARVDACPVAAQLRARVENRGSRGVPGGVPVAFYAGEPGDGATLLGVAHTAGVLLAGAGAWVELEASDLPLDAMRRLRFHAVADDDGTGRGTHSECHEDNNASSAVTVDCRGPN